MFLRDERVLCICIIKDQMVIAGTQKGNIVVFDAESHEQLNTVTDLGDSVLCLKMYCVDNRYLVIAGLANGHVAIFNGNDFANASKYVYKEEFEDIFLFTFFLVFFGLRPVKIEIHRLTNTAGVTFINV